MGQDRYKRNGKANAEKQRTRDEIARAYAEVLSALTFGVGLVNDAPPENGETDTPASAPRKPSGASR